MRVTVNQITFDEYKEGSVAVRRLFQAKQKRAQRRSLAVIFISVTTGLLLYAGTFGLSAFDPMPERRHAAFAFVSLAFPFLGLIMLTTVTLAAQQSRSMRGFAWRLAITLVPAVAVYALLGVLLWLTDRIRPLPSVGPQPPRDWYGTFAPHVGWFLIVLMTLILGIRATRRQSRLIWEAQPSLMRIKEFDITSTGVHIDEGVSDRTYKWPALVRFIETQNLMILCPSEVTFEILPKRSFASPEDLQVAQSLFHAQIVPPGTAPPAFPVLPARQP